MKFFKAEDFKEATFDSGAAYPWREEYADLIATIANAKLEVEFGNEYSIVMFWKEKLEEERKENSRLREALEFIITMARARDYPTRTEWALILDTVRATLESKPASD